MNWVDRRFNRESNLSKAAEVWNDAAAAIHDAVNSFTRSGSHGTAQVIRQSGNCILIEVEQPETATAHFRLADPKRRVVVAFHQSQPAITANLDADPTETFNIEADETHCFLKYRGSEISLDKFSELVLDDAFFKPKSLTPARPPQRSPRVGAWS